MKVCNLNIDGVREIKINEQSRVSEWEKDVRKGEIEIDGTKR